jgi:hypothetical protein
MSRASPFSVLRLPGAGIYPSPEIRLSSHMVAVRHGKVKVVALAAGSQDGAAVEEVGRQLIGEIRAVAGCKKTGSDLADIGTVEFAPRSIVPTQ